MVNSLHVEALLHLEMQPQPTDVTCGPTCLHALYNYWGTELGLHDVIDEVETLDHGGTLGVYLANAALRRGYNARIYTYNLNVFDPTWFGPSAPDMRERLIARMMHRHETRLQQACHAYVEYLDLGGEVAMTDLTPDLLRKYLKRQIPIVAGLSSTFLYRAMREWGPNDQDDDIRGDPSGHFVVLCGYDAHNRQVLVADPMRPNPVASEGMYWVEIDRLVCAILLGIVTYDANLMILTPPGHKLRRLKHDSDRGR